jgi:hypothetical protein
VEINFSLIKVRARAVECAALERQTVLLSGILITEEVALAWPQLGSEVAISAR